MAGKRIKCDNCGLVTTNGHRAHYKYFDATKGREVVLHADQPYRTDGTHVCDRFDYGTFRAMRSLRRRRTSAKEGRNG